MYFHGGNSTNKSRNYTVKEKSEKEVKIDQIRVLKYPEPDEFSSRIWRFQWLLMNFHIKFLDFSKVLFLLFSRFFTRFCLLASSTLHFHSFFYSVHWKRYLNQGIFLVYLSLIGGEWQGRITLMKMKDEGSILWLFFLAQNFLKCQENSYRLGAFFVYYLYCGFVLFIVVVASDQYS